MMNAIDIAERALSGFAPTQAELAFLYSLGPDDPAASEIFAAARKLREAASGGRGKLYAQIGIDAGPCPCNCHYCTFAACNVGAVPERADLEPADVVEISAIFAELGVECISLMTTGAYPLEAYLDLVKRVREAVGSSVELMSNIGDLGAEEAAALKEAGIDVAYHAVRLGEGEITGISPLRRWQTLDALRAAGLRISTGVGPIHTQSDPDEIAAMTLKVLDYDPVCAGTTSMHVVPGTKLDWAHEITMEQRRFNSAVFRLAAGTAVPFGNDNSAWADAGSKPRGSEHIVSREALEQSVVAARKALLDDGWAVG